MYGKVIKSVVLGTDIDTSLPIRRENAVVSLSGMAGMAVETNMDLTEDMLTQGILLMGETGSGKTYCLKRIVSELRKKLKDDYSMIFIQAKGDINDCFREGDYRLEQGLNSTKSVRWNLFRDILKDGYEDDMVELNTRELVAHFFADKKDQKEQFFVDGAKVLLYNIILNYIKTSKSNLHARKNLSNKGLREFFLNYDVEAYKKLIEQSREPGVLKMVLGEYDQAGNLQALGVYGELVTTVLNTLVDIFADEGDFSVREFVDEKEGRALFINYDPAYKDSQVKIFSSIVKLVLKQALAQNASNGKTILICDELPAMGKTDIAEAVNLGRSKGLITILGIQSIAQLYSIYGEFDALKVMAGMCTKFYFKPNDSVSRQYMVDDFGKVIADYMILSPGGTRAERREGMMLEDDNIVKMQTGDCFVKCAKGEVFRFHLKWEV